MITIHVFAGMDDTVIVWKPSGPIPGCRGFAIARRTINSDGKPAQPEFIETWVGFTGQVPTSADEHRSSQLWPVQRLIWTDYKPHFGDSVQYRVIPMLGTADHLTPDESQASDWSNVVTLGNTHGEPFRAYFNRGIVSAQWLSHRMGNDPTAKKLGTIIGTVGDKTRNFLAGDLRMTLLSLLSNALATGLDIYAALFELDDPDLIAALKPFGKRAHIILANGAKVPDANADGRTEIHDAGLDVCNRLFPSGHLGHNKFVVFAKPGTTGIDSAEPLTTWTGSTNWTKTGLCTQANNGILIDSPELARIYYAQWLALRQDCASSPMQQDVPFVQTNTLFKSTQIGPHRVTALFTPTKKRADLVEARQHIRNAKQGVLFLMFNPGTEGSLLNEIEALRNKGLFLHGVVNQRPSSKNAPPLTLFDRSTPLKLPAEALVPKAVTEALSFWEKEMSQYNIVKVHSKVIVVDPFGQKPVVMTGSHNLGPKASADNDDNLLIIENAPRLAETYAVNILSIYDHYKWRNNEIKGFTGLQDDDQWLSDHLNGPQMKEVDFWFGEPAVSA